MVHSLKPIGNEAVLIRAADRLILRRKTGVVAFDLEVPDLRDAVCLGDDTCIAAGDTFSRVRTRDGHELSRMKAGPLASDGRFVQSSAFPQVPVWHGERPVAVQGTRLEELDSSWRLALPVSPDRRVVWSAGRLALRRGAHEVWRQNLGDARGEIATADVVLDGRAVALVQQRGGERRVFVVALSDGSAIAQLRIAAADEVIFAGRRGVVLVRNGRDVEVVDLRFGRRVSMLALPADTLAFTCDDRMQDVVIVTSEGAAWLRPADLAREDAPTEDPGFTKEDPGPLDRHSESRLARELPPDDAGAEQDPAPAPDHAPDAVPAPVVVPAGGLVQLVPLTLRATASPQESELALELEVQLVGARAYASIADAWDSGRLSMLDAMRLPFEREVKGLLLGPGGLAAEHVADAHAARRHAEEAAAAARRERAGRLTSLDVVQRTYDLSDRAMAILVICAAPSMRGEFARLYGILTNDPARGLVDEQLVVQILGPAARHDVATELDADRPLRRHGLITMDDRARPFGRLVVDPLVARILSSQRTADVPGDHVEVRTADRTLDQLELSAGVLQHAVTELARPRRGHARIVVTGRAGTGRRTLLASLARLAHRDLGLIDAATLLREPATAAPLLASALRSAHLRGLLPCISGLELLRSDEPHLLDLVSSVLALHPGPLAIRLPVGATAPLAPGFVQLELAERSEGQRRESWRGALDRRSLAGVDERELAARFRIGPGTIERVVGEVTERLEPGADPAAIQRALDAAVRRQLENRIGSSATRVTRLARWSDIVLPDDITDALVELTARVRYRHQVFERWGFDRSMTTSRGITALFSGPPGTGKTMVAGVIARELGLDLYRVDVSRITSKWIGETEKNLGELFDAAEDGQVMLLFDEADSLFARRTEVKSSVDRYANMEVNYLLQRLDSFEGVAILTTNFGTSIDPALKRRLTYKLTLPFPDDEMREQLWRSMIPRAMPTDGNLDFSALARRFRIAGGHIRNAALRAAFLAAEEGSPLTQVHLERAVTMEFREIGKLADSGSIE